MKQRIEARAFGHLSAPGSVRRVSRRVWERLRPHQAPPPESERARGTILAKAFLIVAAVLASGSIGTLLWVRSLSPFAIDATVSRSVVDRHGKLLRAYAMPDGRWRLPVDAHAVDPTYRALLIAAEDKRFRTHLGVDPLAMLRAASQLVTHGRIVSGGSTLTMQVARLIAPRRERSFAVKIGQIVRAIQLERALSKDEILDLYLTLAPFGGNLEGVRAASLAYFGKEPRRLTLAESAMLVALPQAPETRRLDRHPDAARVARDRVLTRMAAAGQIPRDDATQAMAARVPTQRKPMPAIAPHAADQALAAMPEASVVKLTLDLALQRSLEALARDRATALGPTISMALIAIDHASGEVIASVGSPDYFDDRRAGQVDMTRAVRSPGSTLKPFIYGLAFEDGFVHPESLIEDRPVRFGNYVPENFDMSFQGTVPVRRALQLSLNVPAIALLDRVGANRLASRLRQAGVKLVLPKDEVPGLAMGLGGVGISLRDLSQLYAGLARGGGALPLRQIVQSETAASDPLRLLDTGAAWQVGNVLIGTPPPDNAVHNRIAFKTGTSYGYRDAWSVGFDGRTTIGVWVGRPDGAPVPGLVGRSAAAPILFDAFARTGKVLTPLQKPPRGVLMASNAKLPLALRRFRPAGELIQMTQDSPPRIQYPLNGSRIDAGEGAGAALPVKVAGGTVPMTMLVNGVAVGTLDGRRQRLVEQVGPGFVRLTVMDAAGAADTVVVRIQ